MNNMNYNNDFITNQELEIDKHGQANDPDIIISVPRDVSYLTILGNDFASTSFKEHGVMSLPSDIWKLLGMGEERVFLAGGSLLERIITRRWPLKPLTYKGTLQDCLPPSDYDIYVTDRLLFWEMVAYLKAQRFHHQKTSDFGETFAKSHTTIQLLRAFNRSPFDTVTDFDFINLQAYLQLRNKLEIQVYMTPRAYGLRNAFYIVLNPFAIRSFNNPLWTLQRLYKYEKRGYDVKYALRDMYTMLQMEYNVPVKLFEYSFL